MIFVLLASGFEKMITKETNREKIWQLAEKAGAENIFSPGEKYFIKEEGNDILIFVSWQEYVMVFKGNGALEIPSQLQQLQITVQNNDPRLPDNLLEKIITQLDIYLHKSSPSSWLFDAQ